MRKNIYLIGSLKNLEIRNIANKLRTIGYDVFDDWISGGSDMDRAWQEYEKLRDRTYKEAVRGYHARNVFNFDRYHLDKADIGILILPAGRSGHLELGYMIGAGKRGFVLFDKEPEHFDQMYQLCEDIFFSFDEMLEYFKGI